MMQQQDKADNNPDAANKHNRNPFSVAQSFVKRLPVGLRNIFFIGLILWVILIAITIFHPSLNERIKFFTDMTLNLAIGVVVAVQAYVYTKQRDVMHQQWDVMGRQSRTMLGTWQVIRRQTRTLERQAKIMAESLRAVIGIKDLTSTFLREGYPPQVTVLIHNAGETPAKSLTASCEFTFERSQNYRTNNGTDLPKPTESGITLPAHERTSKTLIASFILTKEQEQAIKSDRPTKVLVLDAVIHYDDFLGEHQVFPFKRVCKDGDNWEDY